MICKALFHRYLNPINVISRLNHLSVSPWQFAAAADIEMTWVSAHFSAPSSHLPLHDFAHPSPIARWLQEANFAQIGICIEPLLDIVGATPASHAAAPTLSDFVQFMQATVENFYQFVTSFTTPREEASCSPG